VSDATADVLDLQLRTGVGSLDWYRLDGSGDAGSVEQSARGVLRASNIPSLSSPS
jgi:hypothetical protein